MSVFTPVSADDLHPWLARYCVGRLIHLQGIGEGVENTNYFLSTRQGRYVLTLFERLSQADLPFYLHLMAHLARHGLPCPTPIADRDNEYLNPLHGKPAALITRLPGKAVTEPTARHTAVLGELLASLHLAGQSYGRRLENPRGPRWWHQVTPLLLPRLPGDEAALLRDELAHQSRHRSLELPRGVIHADLFRDNVLFDGEHIGGLIDFYFAGHDVLLFDVAVTVNDWCLAPNLALDPARTQALLQAYQELRPFTPGERQAWPLMLRAAALRFWLSRLYDYHLPRAGELVLVKDPGHFRDMLRRRREEG